MVECKVEIDVCNPFYWTIFLRDQEKKIGYTFKFDEHQLDEHGKSPYCSTFHCMFGNEEILKALCKGLTEAGFGE